jgi:hypothetical protein
MGRRRGRDGVDCPVWSTRFHQHPGTAAKAAPAHRADAFQVVQAPVGKGSRTLNPPMDLPMVTITQSVEVLFAGRSAFDWPPGLCASLCWQSGGQGCSRTVAGKLLSSLQSGLAHLPAPAALAQIRRESAAEELAAAESQRAVGELRWAAAGRQRVLVEPHQTRAVRPTQLPSSRHPCSTLPALMLARPMRSGALLL